MVGRLACFGHSPEDDSGEDEREAGEARRRGGRVAEGDAHGEGEDETRLHDCPGRAVRAACHRAPHEDRHHVAQRAPGRHQQRGAPREAGGEDGGPRPGHVADGEQKRRDGQENGRPGGQQMARGASVALHKPDGRAGDHPRKASQNRKK